VVSEPVAEVSEAEPGVSEPVAEVSEAEPGVSEAVVEVSEAEPGVSEPVVGAVAEAAEPWVFGPEVVSAAESAQPLIDIAVAFAVLAPVSVAAMEVDSLGRPKFLAFPNVAHCASPASSVRVVGRESVHSSNDARASYALCSILSNLGLRQNRNSAHCCNNPNPGYSNATYTNDLPTGATTSCPKNTGLRLPQERRTRRPYQAALPHPEASRRGGEAAGKQAFHSLQALPPPVLDLPPVAAAPVRALPPPVLELPLVAAVPVIYCSQSM